MTDDLDEDGGEGSGYVIKRGLIDRGFRTDIVLDRAMVLDLVVRFFREGTDSLGNIGAIEAEPEPPVSVPPPSWLCVGAALLQIAKTVWWKLGMMPLAWHHPRYHDLVAMLRLVLEELVQFGAVVSFPDSYSAGHPHGRTGYAPGPTLSAMPYWLTGSVPDLSGMGQYTLLIRSASDSERVDIRLLPSEQQDRTSLWRRKLKKASVADWMAWIDAHLADGIPRTFNRIVVEMIDKTADIVAGLPPEQALWKLVEHGRVAFTVNTSPVLLRRVLGPPPAPKTMPDGKVDDLDTAVNEVLGNGARLTMAALVDTAADLQHIERGLGSWERDRVLLRILERLASGSLERDGDDDDNDLIWRTTPADLARRTAHVTSAPQEAPRAPAPPRQKGAPAAEHRDIKPEKGGTKGGGWSSGNRSVACDVCGQEYPRDPALEVPCPDCKVKIGAWCKRPSGHKAMSLHASRLQASLDAGFEHPCPGAPPPAGAPGPVEEACAAGGVTVNACQTDARTPEAQSALAAVITAVAIRMRAGVQPELDTRPGSQAGPVSRSAEDRVIPSGSLGSAPRRNRSAVRAAARGRQ